MSKFQKLLKGAKEQCQPDEQIICSVLGAYETKILGADSVRSGILVATSRRLIFYAKKFIGFETKNIPYKAISSVEYGHEMLGDYIGFVVSGNDAKIKWISEGDVPTFVEVVQRKIEGG